MMDGVIVNGKDDMVRIKPLVSAIRRVVTSFFLCLSNNDLGCYIMVIPGPWAGPRPAQIKCVTEIRPFPSEED